MSATRLALFSAESVPALLAALHEGRQQVRGGPARLALVDPTPEGLERARQIVERGKPWPGRDGLWFSPRGLLSDGGKLAFVFPGVDISFQPRLDDVARHFALPLPPRREAADLQELGVQIIGANRLVDQVLRRLGLVPHDVAGHSIGEWSAMIATGVIPDHAVDAFIAKLVPGSLEVPGVVFAMAGCGVDQARRALDGLSEIALSHDNCPHQVLLCGVESALDVALGRLREAGVICQTLPFRSGFHSPLFADYLEPHRRSFAALPLASPRTALWSATTCAPYPTSPDAIRALAIDHLVQPVRFRELTETLYAQGTRVFVQAGTGSLVQLIDDTLRGRPHLAVAANVKERPGLDQLVRLAAALFVEGAEPRLAELQPPPAHPLLVELQEGLRAIADAEREVVERFFALSSSPVAPRERTITRTLSLETLPELVDHALVRQPPAWTNQADREPVVPMTTLLELMMEAAAEVHPEGVPIAVEQLRAHRWLTIAPPVDVPITCRAQGDQVRCTLGDYCEGLVIFAEKFPEPPPPDETPLARPVAATVAARTLYDEHWLFHGPAFQGIAEVGVLGDDGIRGTLVAGAARGALLDSAGQLFGHWFMERHERDRMAMPVRLGRVRRFGPHPAPGETLSCTVRVRHVDDRSVVGDLTLACAGRVWAVIDSWENRRFETDERFWSIIRWPERNLLSQGTPEGFVIFDDRYRTAATRDRLARRFLGERERDQYLRLTPRRQRTWLRGRIAAKDAVRHLLSRSDGGLPFPVEVTIDNAPSGQPLVVAPGGRDVRISIAHKDDVAVALAREARPAGIDIERVEPRSDSFAAMAFSTAELRLVSGESRDEAWTRLWAAKEAAAKAKGTGLAGAPAKFPVLDRAGTRLLVGDTWIDTKRHGHFVIAWTNP